MNRRFTQAVCAGSLLSILLMVLEWQRHSNFLAALQYVGIIALWKIAYGSNVGGSILMIVVNAILYSAIIYLCLFLRDNIANR